MRALTTFIVILASAFAAAPAMAKTWADQSCSIAFVSQNDTFSIIKDGEEPVFCEIANWPTGSKEATMKCADGSSPKLSIVDRDGVSLDSVELYLVTDDGPICD